MNSPCLTCTRVKDPKNCESKVCKDWQAWFISRWDAMRERIRDEITNAAAEEHGVPLGGHRYASPHQVRDFLKNDPCKTCYCPKELCEKPCRLRLAWLERTGGKK